MPNFVLEQSISQYVNVCTANADIFLILKGTLRVTLGDGSNSDSFEYYVPLLQSLKALLQHPEIFIYVFPVMYKLRLSIIIYMCI